MDSQDRTASPVTEKYLVPIMTHKVAFVPITRQYIRLLRLDLAQRLLLTTDREVRTIAQQCGFKENCYFANCFKQEFGLTPQAYRQQAIK